MFAQRVIAAVLVTAVTFLSVVACRGIDRHNPTRYEVTAC